MAIISYEFDSFLGAPATKVQNSHSHPQQYLQYQRPRCMTSRRGLKSDHMAYTVLKEEKQWDSWYWSTLAQAPPQEVSEVLDRNYTPVNITEIALFE